MNPTYVIDATVLLEDLLQSPGAPLAATHRFFERCYTEEAKLIAPVFLDLEISNLLQAVEPDPAKRDAILSMYNALDITKMYLQETILQAAMTIATATGSSVYDAQYHALAVAQKATYITCNYRYAQVAHHLGSLELLA